MNLGNRLYEFRKEKKISQEEAAEKLNVTRQTISKWETNQSQPDFDKIIPICELYGITTDILFGREENKKHNDEATLNKDIDMNIKKKTGFIISASVFLYFIAVIWIIISTSTLWIDESIAVGIFLFICAIATVILIYHFVSLPKKESLEKQKQKELEKYDGLIAILFTCIYLSISFITQAWHITWLIWIVYALIIEALHLILEMKGKK